MQYWQESSLLENRWWIVKFPSKFKSCQKKDYEHLKGIITFTEWTTTWKNLPEFNSKISFASAEICTQEAGIQDAEKEELQMVPLS